EPRGEHFQNQFFRNQVNESRFQNREEQDGAGEMSVGAADERCSGVGRSLRGNAVTDIIRGITHGSSPRRKRKAEWRRTQHWLILSITARLMQSKLKRKRSSSASLALQASISRFIDGAAVDALNGPPSSSPGEA